MLGTALLVVIFLATSTADPIHVSIGSSSRSAQPVRIPVAPPAFQPPRVEDVVAAQQNADRARLLSVSWIVLAATTAGAAMLGWLAAGRVLRPVREITTTARTVSAGSLHRRLSLAGPDDEFKRLGDTLDDLFGRLEGSFEAQRRFVANASHELRTPLTLQRTLLQVALADPDASARALRGTCEELLVSQTDQERLLEALLTLASSERELDHREPVDLAELVQPALGRLAQVIERRGLTVQTTLEPAHTAGDPALIARLVANLIDNAVDHNVPGGQVAIETGTAPETSRAELTVRNTGPHIPPESTERMFEPFQRLEAERTSPEGHHGLGLSIVQAIAAEHHADITARPLPGGGLEITVRFRGP